MSGIPENLMTYELHEDEDLEFFSEDGSVFLRTRGDDLTITTKRYRLQVKHFYFGPQRRYYLSTDTDDAIGSINTRIDFSKALEDLIDALEDKLFVSWTDLEPVHNWVIKRLEQKPFV